MKLKNLWNKIWDEFQGLYLYYNAIDWREIDDEKYYEHLYSKYSELEELRSVLSELESGKCDEFLTSRLKYFIRVFKDEKLGELLKELEKLLKVRL